METINNLLETLRWSKDRIQGGSVASETRFTTGGEGVLKTFDTAGGSMQARDTHGNNSVGQLYNGFSQEPVGISKKPHTAG